MSGGAPAADAAGNLYLLTGNGTFDANTGGNELRRQHAQAQHLGRRTFGGGLVYAGRPRVAQFRGFDHGSGGATILVNIPTGSFLVGGGKEGTLFVLSQSSLGHYGASVTPNNSNAHQNFTLDMASSPRERSGTMCSIYRRRARVC